MRAFVREQSMDTLPPSAPSTPAPYTPSAIPGLAPAPRGAPRGEARALERAASQASLPAGEEEGWTTVHKKERSDSGSRRNSVHTIKQRRGSGEARALELQALARPQQDLQILARPQGGPQDLQVLARPQGGPGEQDLPPRFRNTRSPLEVSQGGVTECLTSPQALASRRPSPKASPALHSTSSFPSLPMFQPPLPPSFAPSGFSFPSQTSSFEPSLSYTPGAFGELGARPKAPARLSSSPEDLIYLSDEEEAGARGAEEAVAGLLDSAPSSTAFTPPSTAGPGTPSWDEAGGDTDREMAQVGARLGAVGRGRGEPRQCACVRRGLPGPRWLTKDLA